MSGADQTARQFAADIAEPDKPDFHVSPQPVEFPRCWQPDRGASPLFATRRTLTSRPHGRYVWPMDARRIIVSPRPGDSEAWIEVTEGLVARLNVRRRTTTLSKLPET